MPVEHSNTLSIRPSATDNRRQAHTVSRGIHISFSPRISNTITINTGGHGYTMHSRSIFSDPSTGQYFENVTITESGARTERTHQPPFAASSGSESEAERPHSRGTTGQVPQPVMRSPRTASEHVPTVTRCETHAPGTPTTEPVYTPGYLSRQTGSAQRGWAETHDYRPSAPPLTLPRNP